MIEKDFILSQHLDMQLTVYMQGTKKLSQLYSLPFGQAVASMHQDEQD